MLSRVQSMAVGRRVSHSSLAHMNLAQKIPHSLKRIPWSAQSTYLVITVPIIELVEQTLIPWISRHGQATVADSNPQ